MSSVCTPILVGVASLVLEMWLPFKNGQMSMGQKGNLAVFESTNISETEEVTPTKIGVHVCYINTYLLEFFESIPID